MWWLISICFHSQPFITVKHTETYFYTLPICSCPVVAPRRFYFIINSIYSWPRQIKYGRNFMNWLGKKDSDLFKVTELFTTSHSTAVCVYRNCSSFVLTPISNGFGQLNHLEACPHRFSQTVYLLEFTKLENQGVKWYVFFLCKMPRCSHWWNIKLG